MAIEHDLIGHEIVINEWTDNLGHPRVDYKRGPDARFVPHLREHERALIQSVLGAYGHASSADLIAVAYSTAPMRLVAQWEADNEMLRGASIPFARALGTPGTGLDRFRAIAEAVRLSDHATAQERAEMEQEAMEGLAQLRGRVNQEVLGALE
jgi:hypothetical protein